MEDVEQKVGVLLPCPFCGGEAKTFGPYGWYRQWGISHSCKAFYSGAQELAQGFPTEAVAIAAWNTRTPSAKLAEVERGWLPIESAPNWEPLIVTNGQWVAMSARSESDDGDWYWAVDPEDGLEWVPTHWIYPPLTPSAAIERAGKDHGGVYGWHPGDDA